jgi:hypothetical protein
MNYLSLSLFFLMDPRAAARAEAQVMLMEAEAEMTKAQLVHATRMAKWRITQAVKERRRQKHDADDS